MTALCRLAVGLVLAGAVAGACDRRSESAKPPAPRSGSQILVPDLPETSSIDWQNFVYDLGSLGVVRATGGRAEFHVVEHDDQPLATQDPSRFGANDSKGTLVLEPPAYVDLDGDRHDEVVIGFELDSTGDDVAAPVYGAYVFTLRDGQPMKLGTITTAAKRSFEIAGATITTADGAVWRWDGKSSELVRTR
ncbi:MAG: hypothetical protein AB7O24_09100 [Kofleriaceae bacterium]